MGQVYDFEKEKLIVGVIYSDEKIYERALAMLVEAFGEIDGESERFSFSSNSASVGQLRSLISHEKNTGAQPFFSTQSFHPAFQPGD